MGQEYSLQDAWRDWAYQPGLTLARYDQSGIGSIELLDTDSLLARWRYTLGSDTAASRLIEHFTQQLGYQISGVLPPHLIEIVCPQCQRVLDSPLLPGQEECAVCSREIHMPPPRRGRCSVCGVLPSRINGVCLSVFC